MATLRELYEVLYVDDSEQSERVAALHLISETQELSSAERDTLRACYQKGPLYDGDLPSKAGRNGLVEKGMLVQVIVRGEDGYNACNSKGFWAVKLLEAMSNE